MACSGERGRLARWRSRPRDRELLFGCRGGTQGRFGVGIDGLPSSDRTFVPFSKALNGSGEAPALPRQPAARLGPGGTAAPRAMAGPWWIGRSAGDGGRVTWLNR